MSCLLTEVIDDNILLVLLQGRALDFALVLI